MSKSTKIRAIPKLVENLTLSKTEAAVLLPIVRGGNLTIGAIAAAVDKTLSQVKKPLKSLIEKGLVEEVEGVLPLYRATPPIIPIADTLESFIEESEKVQSEVASRIQDLQKSTEKTLSKITKGNEKRFSNLSAVFEEYENNVVSTIQYQIATLTTLTTGVLSEYSEKVQSVLDDLNVSLEDNVGEKLKLLQTELDASQKQLAKDSKKISTDFDKWVNQEKTASLSSIAEVEKKAKALTTTAKKVLQKSLTSSEDALKGSIDSVVSLLGAQSLEISNNISELLTNLTDTLKQRSTSFDTQIGQHIQTSRKTLADTAAEALANSETHVESLDKRFSEAINTSKTFTESLDAWKEEVGKYMESASQSVIAQLEQLSSSEKAFLDVVNSSLTGYIERMNASVGEEYKSLRSLARELNADADALTSEARTSIMNLLQAEVTGNKDRLQQTNENLQSTLVQWKDKAAKSIDKKVNSIVKDISSVLETEVSELNSLTDNMASRLKSSFTGVISASETKNDAAIASIRRAADEYGADVEKELSSLVAQHLTSVQSQVEEAKALYESLSQRLNTRLTNSVGALNSQLGKALKEIDTSIEEQVARIDRHADDMKTEFHARMEEMTNQFIAVTQSIESTFSGLVASQTVEARDLIASAHTEFKSSMKSELDNLDSDSIKMQQEFASEIGMRIDSVLDSAASLRRTLDEFTSDKSADIIKRMSDTIDAIETSLSDTQTNLVEIESGTVKQFTENIHQLSREFGTSVDGARENISERLKSLTVETSDILTKNESSVKNSVDTYLSEELEAMQRVLGETSKRLDKLSATSIKKTSDRVEEFTSRLNNVQESTGNLRSKARNDLMTSIAERRQETIVAFDAASVWLDSAISNVSISLETLGSKMNNEVLHLEQGLSKSGETTTTTLRERSQSQISQLEDVGQSFLEHVENLLKTSITEFNGANESAVNTGIDMLADLPDKVSNEAGQIGMKAVSDFKQTLTESEEAANTNILDLDSAVKSTSEEITGFLNLLSEQMIKTKDTTIEKVQQASLTSNQHATRKFESLGLELNASLSSQVLEVIESLSSQVAKAISDIQETGNAGTSEVTDATFTLQGARTDLLKSSASDTNETLISWTETAQKYSSDLSGAIVEANSSATENARQTIEMLKAIKQASQEMTTLASDDTWYLSGDEEICAQILDMAKRAEQSILISTPDIECLDFKKLAKIKGTPRKVLVIPLAEERNPGLDLLKDWRIWQLDSPQLLAVADEDEILIGGQSLTESAICILSKHASYLKLYKDVLGPRLVTESIK